MNADARQMFGGLALVDGLTRETVDALYGRGTVVELDAGADLFALGSEPDALYVLLRGRLVAIGIDPGMEREQAKGFVQPGEIVGEMGLISKKPRSLTIRAQLDSVLFKLSDAEFAVLLERHPEILAPITRGVVQRLRQMLTQTSGQTGPQTVMLVGANAGIAVEEFGDLLKSVLEDTRSSARVIKEGDMRDKLGEKGDWSNLVSWMRRLDEKNSLVFYCCRDLTSDLFRQVLQFTERFVVIGDANRDAIYDRNLTEILEGNDYQHYSRELVLLYHEHERQDTRVADWLGGARYFRHHHVSLENKNSVQRFCRFMTGRAKALVLAGGGTRGWAHVGAMRAVYESGLEFDLVGGTSAGSVVSAIYARGATYEELSEGMDRLLKSSLEVLRMANYTLPLVSISNAKANTLLLEELFGKTQIEQLQRLFFCVSCNITRSEEMVHNNGLLWQALRASCSVPGIAPPVVIGGELYVDGGIINNMPVDVARDKLDGSGHVTAVDLSMTKRDNPKYFFPPVLPLPHLLGHRLGLVKRGYEFSTLGNIIMSTMMACSERRMAENRSLADVVIRPALRGYGMLDDAREELVELGYHAAAAALLK